MRLHDLRPAAGAHRRRRRVGRGWGSGRGKTSGRGTKGQNARAGGGVHPRFEGGQNPISERLPHRRGFHAPRRRASTAVNVGALAVFAPGSEVTPEHLRARGLVKSSEERIKILGDGALDRPLTVVAHRFSASARQKIEAAGGSVRALEAERDAEGSARRAEG